MNRMHTNFYRTWSIAILSVSVLIFCVTVFLVVGQNQQSQVRLLLSPAQGEVKVGNEFSLAVQFSGRDAGTVNATDIRLDFDKTKLKLINALAGPYFRQPLVVKWDTDNGRFALASTPTVSQTSVEGSVVRLTFKALQKGEAKIGFFDSQAYVSKKGGVKFEQSAPAVYRIN